jgi:hypothetical protein
VPKKLRIYGPAAGILIGGFLFPESFPPWGAADE